MRGMKNIFLSVLLGAKHTGDGEVLAAFIGVTKITYQWGKIYFNNRKKCKKTNLSGLIHYDPTHGSDPYKVIIEYWRKVRLKGASCSMVD